MTHMEYNVAPGKGSLYTVYTNLSSKQKIKQQPT